MKGVFQAAVEHRPIPIPGVIQGTPYKLASKGYPFVELPAPYEDTRGTIFNVIQTGTQSVARIVSKKNSRRADHYHKVGNHLCYLVTGKILYSFKPVGALTIRRVDIEPGDAWYTPEMQEHSMLFLEDSEFWAFDSKVSRSHEGYESDLVRLEKPL